MTDIAVFFADSHLAQRAWSSRPIEGDAFFSFSQIISYAVNTDLPLFAAGDLIDRQVNNSFPIVRLYQQLDRLAEAGLTCSYIQGQHEYQQQPWLSGHTATQHLDRQFTHLGSFQLYGLDFRPAGVLQQELEQITPDTDILVAHQVWSEFNVGDYPQGGFGDVPYVKFIFTGDLHINKQIKSRGKNGQQLLAISPGATASQSKDEPPDKYFMVLQDNGMWRKEKLRTRPVIDFGVLNTDDDVDRVLAAIPAQLLSAWAVSAGDAEWPEEVRKPLVLAKASHRLTDAGRRLARALGQEGHLFFDELPPETRASHALLKLGGDRKAGRAATLESALPAYLEAEKLSHLSGDCLRLLQATDVAAELAAMREEALSGPEEETLAATAAADDDFG